MHMVDFPFYIYGPANDLETQVIFAGEATHIHRHSHISVYGAFLVGAFR